MSSWLELRRLRYFVAMQRYGSLSEASRRLNVAQPALTHHLRQMEAALGTQLLTRRRHGVELTPAGAVLYAEAVKVLAAADAAEANLRSYLAQADGDGHPVRIGIIPTLSGSIATGMLSSLAGTLPKLRLHMQELYARESRALMDAGKLDFSITLLADDSDGDLLVNEELWYVCSPTMARAPHGAVAISELARLPLILPTRDVSLLRSYVESVADQHHIPLDVVLEIDGVMPRKEAAVAGLGGTILPLITIQQELASGTLVAHNLSPRLIRPVVLKHRRGVAPALTERIRQVARAVLLGTGSYNELPGDAH